MQNSEKKKAYQQKYRSQQEHKEINRINHRCYYECNQEKRRAYQQKYHSKKQNKEKKRIYDRNYYKKTKEKRLEAKHTHLDCSEHKQEKLQAYQLKYHTLQQHKENKRIYNRKYYKETKERKLEAQYSQLGSARIRFFDDKTTSAHTIGNMEYTCSKCCALMFKDEQHKYSHKDSNSLCYSLCYSYGSVKVPPYQSHQNFSRHC